MVTIGHNVLINFRFYYAIDFINALKAQLYKIIGHQADKTIR